MFDVEIMNSEKGSNIWEKGYGNVCNVLQKDVFSNSFSDKFEVFSDQAHLKSKICNNLGIAFCNSFSFHTWLIALL